jgi:hypothetical protein
VDILRYVVVDICWLIDLGAPNFFGGGIWSVWMPEVREAAIVAALGRFAVVGLHLEAPRVSADDNFAIYSIEIVAPTGIRSSCPYGLFTSMVQTLFHYFIIGTYPITNQTYQKR